MALGLGGPEVGHPPEPFAPLFQRGRAAGLHSAPHAGELVGPASIRGASQSLGAERIAHGVRAIEDPALVAELAASRVALDLCPTSNLRLSVYSSLTEHPLRRLHEAGEIITFNSDDPAPSASDRGRIAYQDGDVPIKSNCRPGRWTDTDVNVDRPGAIPYPPCVFRR